MRKKSRLFAIAEALRGRRTGVTAEALAAQFDVTVRTVYRDLAALQEAGLPLLADRGPGGGYALAYRPCASRTRSTAVSGPSTTRAG